MKFRILFCLIFLYFFSILKAYAIPRCEELYNAIYNDPSRKDVNLLFYQEVENIGVLLKKKWNDKTEIYDLATNKDGYFVVGKITSSLLFNMVKEGDVILSINNIDLREEVKLGENLDIFKGNISKYFEEDEEIIFEILRDGEKILVDKNNEGQIIKNTLKDHDIAYIDFFIKSIEVNEKEGFFTASLETDFSQTLDEEYFLTTAIWDYSTYDKEYKDEKLSQYYYERCIYTEDQWNKLNSVDPFFGIKIMNLIREEKNLRDSSYVLQVDTADWYLWNDNKKIEQVEFFSLPEEEQFKIEEQSEIFYNENSAHVTYKSESVYKIKNNFNLVSFPFDSQKLEIFIVNNISDLSTYEMYTSFWSLVKAEEFKNNNDIQGWDIKNLELKYDQYLDPITQLIFDGVKMEIEIERKSIYYLFKIILPIILILIICWSSVWIDPKEIESRLTITIVCLLSLIAYNFVIDSELPKLEYLTVMDYIILVSYIYATIPNFLAILSFNLLKNRNKNKQNFARRIEYIEARYGLLSYLLIILTIIIVASNLNPDHSSQALTWVSAK